MLSSDPGGPKVWSDWLLTLWGLEMPDRGGFGSQIRVLPVYVIAPGIAPRTGLMCTLDIYHMYCLCAYYGYVMVEGPLIVYSFLVGPDTPAPGSIIL